MSLRVNYKRKERTLMIPLPHFHFWCQKVLPLVYDNSLSYYEVLCKVVKYINDLIDSDKELLDLIERYKDEIDERFDNDEELINQLRIELNQVEEWIDNFDTTYIDNIIQNYIKIHLATMIFVELVNDHIVYFIPETWSDITFHTTEYDINIPNTEDFSLVLSY